VAHRDGCVPSSVRTASRPPQKQTRSSRKFASLLCVLLLSMSRVLLSCVPLDTPTFTSLEFELPSGAPALLVLNNGFLYEILGSNSCDTCSAFVGNTVISNGSPLLLSPVDVNFLVLHHTLSNGSKSFSPTDDLLVDALPAALRKSGQLLSDKVQWHSICECKVIGGDIYAKGSETLALAWLKERVSAAATALCDSGVQDKGALLDALSLCKRFVDPLLHIKVCSLFSVSEADFKDRVEVPAALPPAEVHEDKSAKKMKETPKKGPSAADAKGTASILSFFSPGGAKKK
jgi:hypothetical protein